MLWILLLAAGVILLRERKITLATTLILYWMIFCISGSVFYKSIGMPNKGLCYIMSMVLLFYAGSLLTGKNRTRFFSTRMIDIRSGTVFLKSAMLAAAIVIIISIYRYGYSLKSFQSFLSISRLVRNTDFGGRSNFEKIAMPYIFSAFALDGYFLAYSMSLRAAGEKYKTALPILFSEIILMGVLSTGKSLLVWAIILWLSGFLSGNQEFLNTKVEKGKLIFFVKKYKWAILMSIIILAICLMIMMFARSQKGIGTLIYNMINYGFAQVPCFSIWFSELDGISLQISKGGQLLFGIFDEFKYSEGLSSNFPLNSELYNRGVFSNIYTVFRCVIEDFGITGSVFFWFFFGMSGGIIEHKIQVYRKKVIYNWLLLADYVFVLFSFIISAWHYLTIVLATVFFFVEVFYIKQIKKRRLQHNGGI